MKAEFDARCSILLLNSSFLAICLASMLINFSERSEDKVCITLSCYFGIVL